MKFGIFSLLIILAFAATVSAGELSTAPDFQGAQPNPLGEVSGRFRQLQVRFPSGMQKNAVKGEAFKVSCNPAREGYSSWADNNTPWTYNFKAPSEAYSTELAGGSKCQITQLAELTGDDGKVWKTGTLNYSVVVKGPNVTEIYPAHGFNDTLRESEPVILIAFDGPVDRNRFFADPSNYLSYTSANAPGEKMPLVPVPADQLQQIFDLFKHTHYIEMDFQDRTWVLASIKQNLIPGAQVSLTVQNQVSGDNADVHSDKKFTKDFSVRSRFEAQVQCANPSARGACLPKSPISVVFNGQVKWADIRNSYIEYLPYKSTDRKLVRSYPELVKEQEPGFWNSVINTLADYFPFLAKFSDTIVDSITFDVSIEPQTDAKVVLVPDLKDIDGRPLSNTISEFHVRIGAMNEIIHVPQTMSFFEKNVPNLYLPVGVVNLNQHLSIRKTGTDPKVWSPIQDVPTMIRVIRAYEERGAFRKDAAYVSPLEKLKVSSTLVGQQLTGTKNRPNFLQFPFGSSSGGQPGGFYAIEVSSPTYEAGRSDAKENQYYNPKYVLAQVTDLAVHLKKGKSTSLVWVTRLSEAQPVAGAEVEIYNCLGQPMKTLKTNASGLASFTNQEWAKDCRPEGENDSNYFVKEEYYVVARAGGDTALTHSSWLSSSSYAMSSPGVDWYYSDMVEGQPHFHAIIGVNLVKPGQQVPIQIVAKMPNAKGFGEVPTNLLPTKARILNSDDSDLYYEFPLSWKDDSAQIQWQVPADDSAKLGRYSIILKGPGKDQEVTVQNGDVEVAEFKVPLMSGIIAFPTQALVQPDSIPVNAVIRYANGVGAKNLSVDLSYYFEPTSLEKKDLADFTFGNGPLKLTDEEGEGTNRALPSSSRPATVQGLSTAADGSLTKDLALEKAADGRSVAEVLKTLDRPQKLVVRVRYQDQVGEYQTLSQGKDIFNSVEYVGTHLVSGNRGDAKLQAAVLNVNQQVSTALQDLDIKVVRVDTKVIGEELYGGLIKNTLERELKPVRWALNCKMQGKIASCPVGPLKEGSYVFEVTSKVSHQAAHTLFKVDSTGRVYGQGDYYQFGDDEGSKQLPLALNKKTYKNGDRAVVSFPAPFKNCRALVSVERSDIMQAFVVPNACEKGFVEVPVDANSAPNAFVSVYAITGRADTATLKPGETDLGRPTYRLGFANMKVNWSHFKSAVTVKTDKDKYQPGETVQVQVNVRPEEGGLKNGTVTLVAIEEKILELKKNDTYKILEALMQLRSHDVQTITPLERVETVTTANNTDLPDDTRKGGDEGGDGSSKSEFKRKLFNALVTFQAGIPVENGVAKATFKTNDSLTRFKVFAIAMDANQKFGTGEATYLSEKDTQSYSNIPSVAHAGDMFPVKVTIQNNGAKAATYRVEVVATVRDSNGNVIGTKTLTKQAPIDKGSSTAVDVGQFAVGENTGSVQYVIRVYDENGKLVDVMEPAAQSILASVPLAIHDSYIVQVDGSAAQTLTKELNALADKGEIRVSLSKSLVTGTLQQIQRRMEQDIFADFFVESRFNKALLNGSAAKPEEMKKVFETFMGSMDSSGFLKYYPQASRGSVWLTASVVNSLRQEPWALKLVPPALAAKLKVGLSLVLTKSVDPHYVGTTPMDWMRAQTAAGQAAYAFNDAKLQSQAQAVNAAITSELQRNPAAFGDTMDKWSNADLLSYWLLQVLAAPQEAVSSAAYQQMIGPSRLVFVGNSAQLAGQPRFARYYSDETIETAQLLSGHSSLHLNKDLARTLAVGLVNANTKGWYSSETLAGVAQGLKNFGRAYEAEGVTGTANLAIVELQQNTSVDWSKVSTAELRALWNNSKATVQVTQAGAGKPWLGVQTLTAVPLTSPRSQGLAIDKEIRNVTRDSGYKAGDLIEVTLNIHAAGTLNNIALQDPIPAGSNILGDAYGDYSTGEKSYAGYKLFFEYLPSGITTVKYQYQLNNPGTFVLPPTRAEGLYMPSVFGETPNATVNVE